MDQLKDMGYPEDECQRAWDASGGSIETVLLFGLFYKFYL